MSYNRYDFTDLMIELDAAGFPMIYIPDQGFAIHWMPVTKIQVEYFLSVVNDSKYNEDWYTTLLGYSKRVSPDRVRPTTFNELFVTGILPSEAQRFSQWCGRGYDLPTEREWSAAADFLDHLPAAQDNINLLMSTNGIRERTARVIKALEGAISGESRSTSRSVVDQAVMRGGIYEFVYEDDRRDTFGAMGQPSRSLTGRGKMLRLTDSYRATGMRHAQYGFRLIHREGSV